MYTYFNNEKYKSITKDTITYYKYEAKSLSSLPTFTSNGKSSPGELDLTLAPSEMYNSIAHRAGSRVPNIQYYPVITFNNGFFKPTWYTFEGWVIGNQLPSSGLNSISGSNDGNNWTMIQGGGKKIADNKEFYKYFKLHMSGSEPWIYGTMGVMNFNMSGEVKIAKESSKDDYDFYKNSIMCYDVEG